jgi:K+-transporting ATPase ATPase B chain
MINRKESKGLGQALFKRAVIDAMIKLDPRNMVRNPVMFVVEVGSILTTGLWIQALFGKGEAPAGFIGAIAIWLWFTVIFANFSEAVAEGRGKAQAEALRRTRKETQAKKIRTKVTRLEPSTVQVDHPVEEALTRIGADLDDQPI